MVTRLFGSEDLEAHELLGRLTIEANEDILLALGPFVGTCLGSVAEVSFTQPLITHRPEDEQLQVLG